MVIASVSSQLFLKFPPHNHFTPIRPPKPRSKILCCISLDPPKLQTSAVEAKETKQLRVVFAAGGAGGQIFPAVAIADEIRLINPDAKVLFIGTDDGMESSVVPNAGYEFSAIRATPLARPILSVQNLGIPWRWILSMKQSWNIMKDFEPQIVVGTGGYVSFPICLIAALKGLRMVIHEQSAVPGLANWVLSKFADLVFVAYNASVDLFDADKKKIVVSGNPVRLSVKNVVSKEVARAYFFPRLANGVSQSDVKVLLVLGGSFGANSMNIALFNIYNQMLVDRPNLYIIWETGVESYDEMESLVRSHPRLVLAPFLRSMDMAYGAADLVVSRAGSMTCTELLVTGKPAILGNVFVRVSAAISSITRGQNMMNKDYVAVILILPQMCYTLSGADLHLLKNDVSVSVQYLQIPSPVDAEGHQFRNASLMADLAGSRIIMEDELDSTTLRIAIKDIMDNELLLSTMSERALQAAKPNAGAEIAERVISLVKSSPVKA